MVGVSKTSEAVDGVMSASALGVGVVLKLVADIEVVLLSIFDEASTTRTLNL